MARLWIETPSHSLWRHCNVIWKNYTIENTNFVLKAGILNTVHRNKFAVHVWLTPELSHKQNYLWDVNVLYLCADLSSLTKSVHAYPPPLFVIRAPITNKVNFNPNMSRLSHAQ